ncbi:MAG: hypothetical protein PWP46_2023 [Fusobacteriaceae bacterium]|nr:hypothetical protein [Fusobacteriaceae bacterium]
MNLLQDFFDDDYNLIMSEPIISDMTAEDFHESLSLLVQTEFNSVMEDYIFIEVSVGLVLGITLNNVERKLVKILPGSSDYKELESIIEIQQYLYDNGFPCPKV